MYGNTTWSRLGGSSRIWRLAQRRPMPANAYVVEMEQGLLLVDSGSPGRPGEMLGGVAAVEAETGKRLTALAVTHGHLDHAGALAEIVAARNVPVYAHPAEVPFLTGERYYGSIPAWWGYRLKNKHSCPPVPADMVLPLEDGARLGPLQAFHTPGHAPGHLAFFHADESTWLVGDLLMHVGGLLTGPVWFYTYDIRAARRSARRLLEPGRFETVCFAHGDPMRERAMERVQRHSR